MSEVRTEMGSFASWYDRASRVVRIRGQGFWSQELLDRHFAELRNVIAEARRHSSSLRVIVDLTKAGVQTAEISQSIEAFRNEAYGPEDRVAIVVSSSLVKLQLRRSLTRELTKFFISLNAAETWARALDFDADLGGYDWLKRAPVERAAVLR